MATTNQGFIKQTAAGLVGASVAAAGQVIAMNGPQCVEVVAGGGATRLDKTASDLSVDGFAKNGAVSITLSGTTPVTLDLTDTTGVGTSYAGDTTFGTLNKVKVTNTGAAAITVAPGGSNPAPSPLVFAGTSPTKAIAAGGYIEFYDATGGTVDSTHKNLLITPTSGGSVAITVGGA